MERINIFRSWKSNFYHRDILDALKVYTAQELSNIRSHGYNGIWLRGKLHKLTPSNIFPEFGQKHGEYLKILNILVKRTNRYKMKVYIYFNEPLALLTNDSFWRKNRDVIGEAYIWPFEPKGVYYSLCTSTLKVRNYIEESLYLLFKMVQGLGGVICITASEYITSCYSHIDITGLYNGKIPGVWKSPQEMKCYRCKTRSATEVIAELLNTMHAGIAKQDPSAKLIAWNWTWDLFSPDPQKEIISNLNRNIILMSDFERGGTKKILGENRRIDEYSLSYIGPSEKFKKALAFTGKTGHRLMTKLQVGTTHELATVPNLPLIDNIYKKVKYIKSKDIYGVMATWNMGNMRTLNTYVFGQAMKSEPLTKNIFYHKIVKSYLKINHLELAKIKIGWQWFAQAMNHYPFSVVFLYNGLVNYSPGYWLPPRRIKGTPLGDSWVILEKRGDDLSDGVNGYGLSGVIKGLSLVCKKWDKGIEIYKTIFQEKEEKQIKEEYFCALAIGHIFRSALHIYKLYSLCRGWDEKKCFSKYIALCQKEIQNCQSLLPILFKDKRLGFHAECQGYMFNTKSVQEKINMLMTVIISNKVNTRRSLGLQRYRTSSCE